MYMDNNIQNLLTELYDLDPTLQSKEKELRRLLPMLQTLRPRSKPNPEFVRSLREEVNRRAALLAQPSQPPVSVFSSISAILSMRMTYVALGAIVMFVLAVPTTYYVSTKLPDAQPLAGSVRIEQLSQENAFGDLAVADDMLHTSRGFFDVAPKGTEAPAGTSGVMGLGAGPEAGTILRLPDTAADATATGGNTPFRFDGSLPVIPETGEVFKRDRSPSSGEAVLSMLRRSGFTLVNPSSIIDPVPLTFDVVDQVNHYAIHIDFQNATVSINSTDSNTGDVEDTPEVLSQEEAKAAAAAFIERYDIDVSSYGDPIVVENTMLPWQTVIYPFTVDGVSVYDTGGIQSGMTVTVNTTTKRVESLYGVQTQVYQSSSYRLITDHSEIVARAEQGGIAGSVSAGRGYGATPFSLGEPSFVLLHRFAGTQAEEFLVPALVFPVQQAGAGSTSPENVIVPLLFDTSASGEQEQGSTSSDQVEPLPTTETR
jgi:hypothetical protein